MPETTNKDRQSLYKTRSKRGGINDREERLGPNKTRRLRGRKIGDYKESKDKRYANRRATKAGRIGDNTERKDRGHTKQETIGGKIGINTKRKGRGHAKQEAS